MSPMATRHRMRLTLCQTARTSYTGHDYRTRHRRMGTFATTRWSLVLSARDGSRLALAELLRNYWHPLYAFVRRDGRSASDAQDLVQGYFLRFVEKDFLASVDADRGRFRSFLL